MTDIVKYDPTQIIRTTKNLKAVLEIDAVRAGVAAIIPEHLNPDKVLKLVLLAANKNPKILQCTYESVLQSVMVAADLGLDISGTLGEGYLVPYGKTCQFIPGYRGLARLAWQTNQVKRIESEVIHEWDEWEYEKGVNLVCKFVPKQTDRGAAIGAYALIEYTNGGVQVEYMSKDQIMKVKSVSKAKNFGPWRDWEDEQWRKTVWRRLSKWSHLSSERYDRALALDNASFDFSTQYAIDEAEGLNVDLELVEVTLNEAGE